MPSINFACVQNISKPAVQICNEILDLARWAEFQGYGILPGIEKAEFELKTANIVGSRIRVHNKDGSTHVEEIVVWQPGRKVTLKLFGFSPPLDRLADHFIEVWDFAERGNATAVTRSFQLYPARPVTRPLLWIISLFFRRAIARQLAQMAATP